MGMYNKYVAEDVQLGDLVYFDDTPQLSNYDEYWEVCEVNVFTGEIIVKLNYLFEEHFRTVHCADIRQLLNVNKASKAG